MYEFSTFVLILTGVSFMISYLVSKVMTCHDLSKWTVISLTLTAATLIVGLIILVTK